jgi:uncharacterized membrane protein
LLSIDLELETLALGTYNALFFLFLIYSYYAGRAEKMFDPSFLLVVSVPQALMALARISDAFTGGPVSDYLTSGAWALFALALLLWAQSARDRALARASMCVFGLVVFKVLLSDISATSNGVRIVGLLLVGAMLYAGGLLVRQINKWEN